MKSQRLFSALVAFTLVAVVGVVALVQGHRIDVPNSLSDALLVFAVPLGAVFTSLKNYNALINDRVAAGEMKPGELTPLLRMKEFYFMQVAALVTALQVFGYKALDETAQALFVDTLLLGITQLLDTFSERPASAQARTVEAPGIG